MEDLRYRQPEDEMETTARVKTFEGWQRSTLTLKFKNEEFKGLKVVMKRLPLGDMMAVSELADMGKGIAAMKGPLDKLLGFLAYNMIEWNLLDETGRPMKIEKGRPSWTEAKEIQISTNVVETEEIQHPSTGMYSLDMALVMALVSTWIEVAGGVDEELGKDSGFGEISQEQFKLMEVLSESH